MLNPLSSGEPKKRPSIWEKTKRQKLGARMVPGLNLDQLAWDLAQEWNEVTGGWTDFAGWEAR